MSPETLTLSAMLVSILMAGGFAVMAWLCDLLGDAE